ncbi:MAG: hypothetical protein V3U29_06025, partial [Phycisphaeraceae bacterium]
HRFAQCQQQGIVETRRSKLGSNPDYSLLVAQDLYRHGESDLPHGSDSCRLHITNLSRLLVIKRPRDSICKLQ